VGVDGGFDDALSKMLLSTLDDRDNTLTVDDGLDFVNHVGNNVLLDEGGSLNHTTHVGGGCLRDVLLNVMDDVLVDLTVNNRLHLNDAVLSDGFLYDRCIYDSGWLVCHVALHHGGLLHGSLLHSLLISRLSQLSIGALVLLLLVSVTEVELVQDS